VEIKFITNYKNILKDIIKLCLSFS